MFRSYGNPFRRMAAHRCLLRLLVAFFLLQHIGQVLFGSVFFRNYMVLSASSLQDGHVWTLLSYALLHGSCLHLLVNGLTLHFIGRFIEQGLGPGHFLKIFLSSTLAGACFWLCLQPTATGSLIGASAGIAGLLAYACLCFPQHCASLLLFLVIPVRLRLRTLLGLLFAFEIGAFLLLELPGRDLIAHSAHLGGLIAGSGYFFCQEYIFRRTRR